MAAGLIIGICSNSDIKALDDALVAQQIDLDKVKVFAADGDGDELETSPLDFIEVFENTEAITGLSDDMTRGTGVLADSGGPPFPDSPENRGLRRSFRTKASRSITSPASQCPTMKSTTSTTRLPTVTRSFSIPTPAPMRRRSPPRLRLPV